jgi:MFS transporter, DHA1 family, inner membrane transport protein
VEPIHAVPKRVLPVIVLAQFAGTSLWFAVNAVMPDLQTAWGLPASAVASLTSAVQLGFVTGTFVFALLMIADRFAPSRVFLVCALLGAACNAATVLLDRQFEALLALRFAVGFLLAGIYPVGMKIAASWYRQGLGAAMGVLIGALVLGTALPHGLRALGVQGAGVAGGWQPVVLWVSGFAALGGLATALLVPESPHLARAAHFSPKALAVIWHDAKVRASVFGYFGHMWELYTFFVLAPAIIATRLAADQISGATFWVLAAGFAGCAGGGLLARRFGSAQVAGTQLAISGACCLLSPLMLIAPLPIFMAWLVVWGITISGDSPQFSTLTAQNAPREIAGSVLTMSNCIGFAITVVSIQLFVHLAQTVSLAMLLPWLGVGPLIGLLMLRPLFKSGQINTE